MSIDWSNLEEWKTSLFDKNTPANEFGHFESFKQLWDDRRNKDSLPAWSDFKFKDFEPWWGWITVENIVPSSSYDAVYRLFGTHVSTLYGEDFTGKQMSKVEGLLLQDDIDLACKMVNEQLISVQTGPMKWADQTYKLYSFIELPLADNGQDIDKFLTLTSAEPYMPHET